MMILARRATFRFNVRYCGDTKVLGCPWCYLVTGCRRGNTPEYWVSPERWREKEQAREAMLEAVAKIKRKLTAMGEFLEMDDD